EGERVIALTQLGTVAALDLFTGRIHWETLYDQNPLPPRRNHNAPRRTQSWRNAPPVVADGVVVATPVDSDDLIGVDLESGALLWSVRQSKVSDWGRGMRTDVNLLLGADETTVYLGGRRLVALTSSAGLRHEAPHSLAWRFTDPLLADEDFPAWPLLLDDRIVVPTTTERVEIHRRTGRRLLRAAPWGAGGGGNLLVGEGMLFALNARSMTGYFEWDLLLTRAREVCERAPEELGPALNLGALMGERGRLEALAGNTPAARTWLDDAARTLTPFLADDELDRSEPRVLAELHGILRSKARVLADLADTRGALSALRAAREMAPDPRSERDTLLEESLLLRNVDEEARLTVLDELGAACGSLFLHAEVIAGPTPAFATPPEGVSDARDGAWRLEPLMEREAADEFGVWELPVGLWVALERAAYHARTGDVTAELEEWHRVLERWPAEPLPPGSAAEVAGGRIAACLEAAGREPYAPFEERARALLERVAATGDRVRLEEVARRFPQSDAARDANDLLLDWAVEQGDTQAVASIVSGELPRTWCAARANEREALLVLRLAAALESTGNLDYPRALLRALAESRADLVSPVTVHGGLTLGELVEREAPARVDTPPNYTFHRSPPVRATHLGRHTLLGAVPPPHGTGAELPELLLFAHDELAPRGERRSVSLSAVSADAPDAPAWTQHVATRKTPVDDWSRRAGFAPGRVLLALDEGVIALGRDGGGEGGGEWLWGWSAPEGRAEAVTVRSGLGLVVSDLDGGKSLIHALDVASGALLWEREIDETLYWPHPVSSEREAVFLPRVGKRKALVLDLFSGRTSRTVQLPHAARKEAYETSWIEDGRLIVPRFMMLRRPEQNEILALRLATGTVDWRVRFEEVAGGGRELHAIVQYAGRTYLVLRPRHTLREDDLHGLLVELNTSVGGHAPVGSLRLGVEHQLIGVDIGERRRLESPFLFLRSFGPGETEMKVHAVHLPYGHERWMRRLPVSPADLYDRNMPMPAVSQTTVALAYSEKPRNARSPSRTLLFSFDKSTGAPTGSQELDRRLGRGAQLRLAPLGDALLLAGEEQLQVMR
ncbi:MAG: PQQ-binding-like beta-propeller repeat protein, partial [Planctomycetota bacterium]|nr:PQQ-binding-like beta-propeller repeat protein [Planctomycetota bacterium]